MLILCDFFALHFAVFAVKPEADPSFGGFLSYLTAKFAKKILRKERKAFKRVLD
jgi:hypothetical protein